MTNDEEPVEKALMVSSSIAVKSEDSANSNLATLMAPDQWNLCPVSYGNLCQGEHQRLCQGEHQCRVE